MQSWYKGHKKRPVTNPGIKIAYSGVKEFILGYNFISPSDNHSFKGFTSEILKKYFALYKSDPTTISKQPEYWISAVKNTDDDPTNPCPTREAYRMNHGNACGIDVSNREGKTQRKDWYLDKSDRNPANWKIAEPVLQPNWGKTK